jgi:hypothetical protein
MQFMKIPVAVLCLLSLPAAVFSQGSLTPPGAPASTMKTLQQVEPRTPLDATHTPGDNYVQFQIATPGSYYLTTNVLGVSGKDGIRITASNVTLDLNGFSLLGTSNAGNGLSLFGGYENITVRNGSVSGWSAEGYNGLTTFAQRVLFENLTVASNELGMFCAGSAVVRECRIMSNNKFGVQVVSGSWITGNYFEGNNRVNSPSYASIRVDGPNNRVDGNHVVGSGVSGYGIWVLNAGGYTNNIIIRNSVVGAGGNNYSVNTVVNDVGPVGRAATNSSSWGNLSL